MCIIFNVLTPHPGGPPIENPKPDPTNPKPSPSPSPTPTPTPSPSPTPTGNELARAGTQRLPFPGIDLKLSASRAHALCMAASAVFLTVAKVESAFTSYADGDVNGSDDAYREAIEHAHQILAWLGKFESSGSEQLHWFDQHRLSPENDRAVRGVKFEDVANLVLHFDTSARPTETWHTIAHSVQKAGFQGVLQVGLDEISHLRALARDVAVSLEYAQPTIRQGELFESFSFRLETTYLERTLTELASGLMQLALTTNYAAAVSRTGASRSVPATNSEMP